MQGFSRGTEILQSWWCSAEQMQGAAEELSSRCSCSAAKVIEQVQSGDEVQQR